MGLGRSQNSWTLMEQCLRMLSLRCNACTSKPTQLRLDLFIKRKDANLCLFMNIFLPTFAELPKTLICLQGAYQNGHKKGLWLVPLLDVFWDYSFKNLGKVTLTRHIQSQFPSPVYV